MFTIKNMNEDYIWCKCKYGCRCGCGDICVSCRLNSLPTIFDIYKKYALYKYYIKQYIKHNFYTKNTMYK